METNVRDRTGEVNLVISIGDSEYNITVVSQTVEVDGSTTVYYEFIREEDEEWLSDAVNIKAGGGE